jgi:hypothetical protein
VHRRPDALTELGGWLDEVFVEYPDAVDTLGDCWPCHPWVVEELLALKAAWHEAYESERASGSKAVDWHDRHRPGAVTRISRALSACSAAAHRPGGRLDTGQAPAKPSAALRQRARSAAAPTGRTRQ